MAAECGITREGQAERGGEQGRANQQPASSMSIQAAVRSRAGTDVARGKIALSGVGHFRHLSTPALPGATIGGSRAGQVAPPLQHHTEIECSPGRRGADPPDDKPPPPRPGHPDLRR